MTDAFEGYRKALAVLGAKSGFSLNVEEDHCSFAVDDSVVVNLEFLQESESAVLWAAVGVLPDDGLAVERTMRLLEMNEPGGGVRGFTLAMNEVDRVLVAHARRDALAPVSGDILAAWIEDLVAVAEVVRSEFAEQCPFVDDAPLPSEAVLHDDGEEAEGR